MGRNKEPQFNLENLSKLFLDEYKRPLILTTGQKEIFNAIVKREKKRHIVICPTRYGKSLSVSLALILRCCIYPEKWCIAAPTEKKARIIMQYVQNHLGDNPIFYNQLELEKSMTYERLRRERSKNRLTFKRGGELFIISADNKNKKNRGESALGFGSANIVLDESSLIDNDIYAMIKRMLGDNKDNFMLEIGNPFKRNHFQKTWNGVTYNKIFIDYKQGLAEGRYDNEYIEEMRKEASFGVLYECQFPDEDKQDMMGYSQLINTEDIQKAVERAVDPKGEKRLGVDVSRGGSNFNVLVLRQDNFARLYDKNDIGNLIDLANYVIEVAKKEHIKAENIFIDDNQLGGGVTDSLRRSGWNVIAVKNQNLANQTEKYINVRAETYWRLRDWIKSDVCMQNHDDLTQLTDIKFKINNAGKIQIQSKVDMKREGIESPDFADALAMTFFRRDISYKYNEIQEQLSVCGTTGYPDGGSSSSSSDLTYRLVAFPDLLRKAQQSKEYN